MSRRERISVIDRDGDITTLASGIVSPSLLAYNPEPSLSLWVVAALPLLTRRRRLRSPEI